jgi:hypothetical protein
MVWEMMKSSELKVFHIKKKGNNFPLPLILVKYTTKF